MAKGSELRSEAEKAELKRALLEFTEKIETDPYQPGLKYAGLMPDDVAEVIEDVLYLREHAEMTIHIKKGLTSSDLVIEVTDRKK